MHYLWLSFLYFTGSYCEHGFTEPTPCAPRTYMPWGLNTTIVADVDSAVLITYHFFAGSGVPSKRQFDCLDCPGG